MSNEFNYAEIEQVADDFAHHKGDYDDLMEDAFKDITETLENVDNRRDGFAASDDVAALIEAHGAKFGEGLSTASRANREKWIPQLEKVLTTAMDMNPQNAASIVKGAYKIEQGYGADTGILLGVAERATFRYKESLKDVVATVDKHMQDYEAQPDQNVATYKAFSKVYTNAFRKTGSAKYANIANNIADRIELLKGNFGVEKLLQQIQDNPANEAAQDAFEQKLNMLMATNPTAGVKDVTENLKAMTKIENAEDREMVYGIVIDTMGRNLKANNNKEKEQKSAMMFGVFDMILKSEKDPEIRKSATVSAVSAIKKDLTDENGALIVAEGAEKETFRALKKMAGSYGDYIGFKDLIVNTAAKYRNSQEKTEELRDCMMRIFDYVLTPVEKESGRPYQIDLQKCSDFENSVFRERRERDNKNNLDTQIYKLLNIPNKKLGVERNPDKPFYPSKEDMRKVANLLSQYQAVDYSMALMIFGKIDKEKLSNVDDVILNKLSERVRDRMPNQRDREDAEKELTAIRTAMHKHGIQQKKLQDGNAPKQWHEDAKPKQEPSPNKRISFSKGIPSDIGIEK